MSSMAQKARSAPCRVSTRMSSLGSAPARQAVVWSAGVNVARELLQFAQMLVLARRSARQPMARQAWHPC